MGGVLVATPLYILLNIGIIAMKKSMLVCLVLLFSISLFSQEQKEVNVSEKVKTEFAKLYPKVKDVKWFKSMDAINTSFIQNGKRIGVIFKADTLFATMTETAISELPKAVKNHIDKMYKGFSIIRAGKMHFVSRPDKNNIAYGGDITNGTITKRVLCYPNGSEMSVFNLPDRQKN